MTLRELPPQDEMVKPRDYARIEVVSSAVWHCRHCESAECPVSAVQWIGGYGRCRGCGQHFIVDKD